MRIGVLILSLPLLITAVPPLKSKTPQCRAVAGSLGWPSASTWSDFNKTQLNGHLISAVPMAKYCFSKPEGACTDTEWTSGFSRAVVPGAACYVRPIRFPLPADPSSNSYNMV